MGRLVTTLHAIEPALMLARPDVLALTDYAVKLRYETRHYLTGQGTDEVLYCIE